MAEDTKEKLLLRIMELEKELKGEEKKPRRSRNYRTENATSYFSFRR